MSLSTAANSGGPVLSAEQVAALVIRPLLDSSIAAQISTVVQTTSHDLRIPVVTVDPQAAWTAEGAEIAVTDPTLVEVVVTPKKLAGLTVISSELANDSSPAALGVVGDGLVRDLRRQIDAAYFGNTVTNGPAGLGSLTTATASNGGAWANLDAFAAAIANGENQHTQVTAFVTSPATALTLSTLKQFATVGSNVPLLGADPTAPTSRTINGIPLYVSPSVGADLVWAIPQQHSLFVLRQDASVVTDNSAFFTSDRVAVRATLRVSFGFTHAMAVTKITKA